VHLPLDGDGPLHRQAYRAIRAAILAGSLERGARLPATRALARESGLARNTLLQAYEQLTAEGYTVARRGAGTFVAAELPEDLGRPQPGRNAAVEPGAGGARPRLSAYGRRLAEAWGQRGLAWRPRRPRLLHDFRYGEPATEGFPVLEWSRAVARCARDSTRSDLDYALPGGSMRLREALARYLHRARGVHCSADDVIVVYGSQQAIDLVARVLVDPGTRVAIEEPAYAGVRLSLEVAGAELQSLPVDAQGLPVDRLPEDGRTSLACVTPSHQFPTGAVLPLARRLELLRWAERNDAFVLEDDYDSEFRFGGRPLESLRSLDRSGRVVYVGTVSKVMFPSLRIGYLVAPEALRVPLLAAKTLSDTGGAGLEQRALAAFIESGQFERHLRRTRMRLAKRRESLLESLHRYFGERVRILDARAGLHLVAWLDALPAERERALRRRAAARSVGVYPVAPFYRGAPPCTGLLLGYASVDPGSIDRGIELLRAAYDEVAAGPHGSRAPDLTSGAA